MVDRQALQAALHSVTANDALELTRGLVDTGARSAAPRWPQARSCTIWLLRHAPLSRRQEAAARFYLHKAFELCGG
jgi:hypothetical protein